MRSDVERVHIHVLHEVFELIGEISSSLSEREVETDRQLENYLSPVVTIAQYQSQMSLT